MFFVSYLSEACHCEYSVLTTNCLLTFIFVFKPFILFLWYVLSWDKKKGHSLQPILQHWLLNSQHVRPEIKHPWIVSLPRCGSIVWPWRSCFLGPSSPHLTSWSEPYWHPVNCLYFFLERWPPTDDWNFIHIKMKITKDDLKKSLKERNIRIVLNNRYTEQWS